MRALLIALTLGLIALPLAAPAQHGGQVARLGFLGPSGREAIEKPFWQGLRDLGWIEGRNLAVERRSAGGGGQLYPELATQLMRTKPDIVVSIATPATAAAVKTTSTVPIVFIDVGDPVMSGFVTSLARPGGNVTGMTSLNIELSAKRLELLRAVLPKLSRVAVVACCFGTPVDVLLQKFLADTDAAARLMNITVHTIPLKSFDDVDGLFATITAQRAEAVIFLPSAQMTAVSARIAKLAIEHRLPVMCDGRINADAGALMAYGIDRDEIYRRAASLVDRVLKGAKPADLPVEQPTKLQFVLNLRTAKVLSLTIPQSIVYRADQVIQ